MGLKRLIKKAYTKSFGGPRGRLENLPHISVNADDYTILDDPQVFKKRIIELIRSAKRRICMTALYLQNDEAGQEILHELYQAQKLNPNLYIRVYVDFHRAQRGLIGKGPQIGNNAWYQELAKQQPQHPTIYGVPVKSREFFGVLHLKGFVFDDVVLYSGASINNVYLNQNGKYRIDRYHEIHSSPLADALCDYCTNAFHQTQAVQDLSLPNPPSAKMLASDIKEQRHILTKEKYHILNEEIAPRHVGVTPLVGLGKKYNILNQTILSLLDSASEEITIYTPYFNLPAPMQKRVNKCLNRGVKIHLVVGDKEANDFFIRQGEEFSKVGAVPYIYEINLRNFIQAHEEYINKNQLTVHLWKDGDNTYHVKGMIVDKKYALITGNNFNPRAWNLDLENGLFIQDPKHLLLERFTHERQYLLQHTRIIKSASELEDINDYPEEYRKFIIRTKKIGAQWLLRKLL